MKTDLTGERFGRYLVLGFAYTKGSFEYWKCRCDCGVEKTIRSYSLKSGATKSCGCLQKEKLAEINKIDLVGQRFDRWMVLEEFGRDKWGAILWKCRCDCGNKRVVCGNNLRNGKSKSCGCLRNEKIYKVDLTEQRFDRYLVLKFDSIKNHNAYWKCLCDCGVVKIVNGANLRSGHTRSCGCLQKETVSEIMRKRTGENHADVSGEKNPNYSSNLTNEEREITRKYPEYIDWRATVYKRDNHTCQCCGNNKGGNLCAHHLESYRDNPELRISLENGVTLCEEYHKNFHHQYGYGNNTREQFEGFLRMKKKLNKKGEGE